MDAPAAPAALITIDTVDENYRDPVIEIDELRDLPVPHRYIRGLFRGTDARFSFYFPPREQYQGRFFHNTYPMALTSDVGKFPIQFDVAAGDLGFTFDSGSAYLQTNNGGMDRASGDFTIGAYRVNAAAAKFARIMLEQVYGPHRVHGYLFGGSGGSLQVIGAIENTVGVWDGLLPFVIGTPYCIPSSFSCRLHPLRVLRARGKFAEVIDAISPGGSGDPYATLNEEERAALREATLNGFPLRGWWNHEALTLGYMAYNMPHVKALDPTYAEDFWSKPGYLGADPAALVHAARIQFETHVVGVGERISLAQVPDEDFADADLEVLSGAAAGRTVALDSRGTNPIGFAVSVRGDELAGIAPGDRVRIDNSWALAMETYQRHQIPPSTELYAWNQYRGEDGAPLYPQRPVLIGPHSAVTAAGAMFDGDIHGKVLVLDMLSDIDALPWHADWYRTRARAHLGEAFDNNFAVVFIENAQHDNPLTPFAEAHTVGYSGALQQGLRDLARWVETGVKPNETRYTVRDTQIVLADGAARGGIQPVATLSANGASRAEVTIGQTIAFEADAEVPPGTGQILAVEWDFLGTGAFTAADPGVPAATAKFRAEHRYAAPGKYFPVVRVTSQREGNAETLYGRIQNIARARVVVRP